MGRNIDKLLTVASPAISDGPPDASLDALQAAGALGEELLRLLQQRNGFYAFEGALHVFPADATHARQNLADWNQPGLWLGSYGAAAEGLVFWAEDVFGCQFALGHDGVYRFEPETGERELAATDLEAWAAQVLSDHDAETGHSLAHEWQRRHGALPIGSRLLPKQLFVLGGSFDVDNLYALDAVKGMQLRAEIARQIRDLPDGTSVTLRLTDD